MLNNFPHRAVTKCSETTLRWGSTYTHTDHVYMCVRSVARHSWSPPSSSATSWCTPGRNPSRWGPGVWSSNAIRPQGLGRKFWQGIWSVKYACVIQHDMICNGMKYQGLVLQFLRTVNMWPNKCWTSKNRKVIGTLSHMSIFLALSLLSLVLTSVIIVI